MRSGEVFRSNLPPGRLAHANHSCHFRYCKALLVTSHATASVQTFAFTLSLSDLLTSAADVMDDPPSEQRAVAISSCHGQIGSSETEYSVSPLRECSVE